MVTDRKAMATGAGKQLVVLHLWLGNRERKMPMLS